MAVENVSGRPVSTPPTRADENNRRRPVKTEENEQSPPERRAEQSKADRRAQEQSQDSERARSDTPGRGENVDVKT